jgi:hypothetical protein
VAAEEAEEAAEEDVLGEDVTKPVEEEAGGCGGRGGGSDGETEEPRTDNTGTPGTKRGAAAAALAAVVVGLGMGDGESPSVTDHATERCRAPDVVVAVVCRVVLV